MDILPITIWREARSEGADGMRGVYWAIANRASAKRWWPSDPEQVCLQSMQFSCWNNHDPQRNLYPKSDDPQYAIATAICSQPGNDPTNGATSYYDSSIPAPAWATPQTFTVQIGKLRFHAV
jgi:spore germination cell wall hydrolase CwlJ-like protein